jgi:hypothetical protein
VRAGVSRFDAAYYARHYQSRRTAVTSRPEMARRARFIGAYLKYGEVPVRSILDAGCGLGWMRRPLLAEFPAARYCGLEVSDYLCRKYGWMQGSLAKHRPRAPYDLVVCYDVLQYVGETEARQAMANLARVTRRALYFSALTQEDWDYRCDQSLTDGNVYLRPAAWYRGRLRRHFDHLGGGLHLRRGMGIDLWELERPPGLEAR